MSAREIPRRDIHGSRGRVAAPTRHIPENPQALTLRDIPTVLKPGEQPQAVAPHFSAPAIAVAPQPQAPVAPQSVTDPADQSVINPDALAWQRASLGFDDIPLASPEELENEKDLREKVGSWAKEAYSRSLSQEKRQRLAKFIKNKEFMGWKDDLKWALKADKGDDVDELQKVEQAPATPAVAPTPPPLNTIADRTQPPRVRVPQRGTQFGAGLRAQSQLQQQYAQPVAPAVDGNNKTIDINISFGSLPKLPKLPKLPSIKPLLSDIRARRWNRRTQITSAIVIVFALFVLPHFLPGTSKPSQTDASGTTVKTEKIAQKPDYQTVTPSGKSADKMGWQRVSPPSASAVYAYADTIAGVGVDVSQQPVPDSFKSNVDDNVANLAKSYNATEKVIAGTTAIYIGTSGDGPQSAIFTKNNLLILVKSTSKIGETDWAKYVESLN